MALHEQKAHGAKYLLLGLAVDSFGDDNQFEGLGQRNEGGNNCPGAGVLDNGVDVGAADPETVDRQSVQLGER